MPTRRIGPSIVGGRVPQQDDVHVNDREIQGRIDQALTPGAIVPVYQPIVDLVRWEVVGVEALAWFPGPPVQASRAWFEDAERVGRRVDLELAALRVEAAALTDPAIGDRFVSLNASPPTIVDPRFAEALAGLPLTRVVLEVGEGSPVDDYAAFARAVDPLRTAGLRLAVDKVGSGYASLRHILALAPDSVNLDASLVSGVDSDRNKAAIASSLVTFACGMGIGVAAKGVETRSELEVVRRMGVQYGQGRFFREPCALADATAPLPRHASGPLRRGARRRAWPAWLTRRR